MNELRLDGLQTKKWRASKYNQEILSAGIGFVIAVIVLYNENQNQNRNKAQRIAIYSSRERIQFEWIV